MNYNDETRGTIQNRENAKQIIDFSSIKYGRITPTDIDGLLEWRNERVVIFMEFKYEDAELPAGQRMALEEITRGLRHAGKNAYTIVCSHHVGIPSLDIDAGSALVKRYFGWKWHEVDKEVTCKQFIDYLWEKYHDRKQSTPG